MRWPNKQTVSMCVNKAFIRKKYIRSIDALETTRRTNEKERDKFSSGVRYGFKQRSNGRCNEMQKDNSSVEDTRISRRKAVLSAYSTLSSLCLIKTGSTCSSVSLSLSLLFFVHLHNMCTYWQTSWPLFLLPVPLIIYHDRYRRLQTEKETS